MVHLPPDPHILASFANANLPWWKALAELVDNSLDAGATRIVIDVTNRVLTVSDDGHGCEDITSLFKLGDHKKRKASKRSLGRYGIGAKDAWLSCSDVMTVQSNRNRIKTEMTVDYYSWMNSNWNVPDPECRETEEANGTTIRLALRQGKNIPADDAFRALAFAFTPAIRSGRQIVRSVKGRRMALSPAEMPLRSDVVQSEFEIDGKSVKIDIGILPDGIKLEKGPFWLIYDHRIIDATSIGAGQYSVRRIAGTITIGDGWSLTKNKDDLSESQDELADAIFVRIKHILEKADHLSETMESAALRAELQDILNASASDANKRKEKRFKPDESIVGSVAPKRTGRKRTQAASTQDGAGSIIQAGSNSSGRKSGYLLDWCELDASILGEFDRSGMRVKLNLNNGMIATAKSQSNRLALTACAVSLIADYCCRHDQRGNELLKFAFADFPQAIGGLVKDYSEGKNDAKSAI